MEMVRVWRPGELTPLEKADAPQPTTWQVGSVLLEFRFFYGKIKIWILLHPLIFNRLHMQTKYDKLHSP